MKIFIFIGVALLAFVFGTVQLKNLLRTKRDLRDTLRKIEAASCVAVVSRKAAAAPVGIEGLVSHSAKESGIKRLMGVGVKENYGSNELHLNWEANQFSSMRFLADLERRGVVSECIKLQLSGSKEPASPLRATGVFVLANNAPLQQSTGTVKPLAFSLSRDVFVPLWAPIVMARADKPNPSTAEMKKQAEAQRMEQERLEHERLKREEAEHLNAKRRHLESFTVTGLAGNGRETMAFVNAGGQGQTVMLRKGDSLGEARVTSIDESRGEVRLDYAGKFEVVLKINALSGVVQ